MISLTTTDNTSRLRIETTTRRAAPTVSRTAAVRGGTATSLTSTSSDATTAPTTPRTCTGTARLHTTGGHSSSRRWSSDASLKSAVRNVVSQWKMFLFSSKCGIAVWLIVSDFVGNCFFSLYYLHYVIFTMLSWLYYLHRISFTMLSSLCYLHHIIFSRPYVNLI